jgi:hypothetical protein
LKCRATDTGNPTFADMSFTRNLNEDYRVSLLAMGDNTGNGAAKKGFLLLDTSPP